MKEKTKVFISYRTADSGPFVSSLIQFLQEYLDLHVVLGGDTRTGRDWRTDGIPQLIEKSDAFVAVIGDQWAKPFESDYVRDIYNNPDDVVLQEVQLGMSEPDRFLPVTLDGFKPKDSKLPGPIKNIPEKQWVEAKRDFDSIKGLGRLTADLHCILDQRQPKPIVLLSSTLSFFGGGNRTEGLDYFTTLVMTIVQQLKTYDKDVILKVPIYASDDAMLSAAHHQRELLRETIEHRDSYSALIVAPFQLAYLAEDLAHFIKDNRDHKRKYPVVTIDKAYRGVEAEAFQKAGVTPPPGFICDGEYDGGLAADSVIAYIKQAVISEPNVVVLQGLQGSEPRIQGFLQRMSAYNATITHEADKVYVAVSIAKPFLPEEAKMVAEQLISDEDSWTELIDLSFRIQNPNRRPRRIDAFFCCNDEMALGVCEYLESAPQDKASASAVVVGFDGIASARRRITKPDQWLLNTVDVRVREQVDRLVDALRKGLETGVIPTETQMIRGELFRSLQIQRKHVDWIRAQRGKAAGVPAV